MSRLNVGILGYGQLGAYLADQILTNPQVSDKFQLNFIYNRSSSRFLNSSIEKHGVKLITGKPGHELFSILEQDKIDLIVEAAHPKLIIDFGERILDHCSVMITSLTALAEHGTRKSLQDKSRATGRRIFIPTGAGWGFEDIRKMSERKTLESISISMTFNADALKLNEPLRTELEEYITSPSTEDLELYSGTVDKLAILAPNNTNTMCGLAMAASGWEFEKVIGKLYASKASHTHIVKIEVEGPGGFNVKTIRENPAIPGAVTGSMTFSSFLSSLLNTIEISSNGFVFV